ncbi:MAG: DNA-binding protein [Chloroflexaceae bacterium]|nr:DNA-binding protein [Chloroflexaceae bacterium]
MTEQTMTTITFTLPSDHKKQFADLAAQFGVSLEDLLRLSIESLIAQPQQTFDEAAAYVLAKNTDLYRRLA